VSFDLTVTVIWLGGTDEQVEGVWRWTSTGMNFGYSNWDAGEPSNSGDEEHYLVLSMTKFGAWNDYSGGDKHFLCEII
jgi:hypothetical protein